MHADVAPRHPAQRDEGLGRAVAWAVGLHLLLAVLLIVSPLLTWDRDRLNAAGAPTMEATLDASAADQRAVERALDFTPAPMPEPVDEPAPEDTVPPPQPIPEPAPQDAPVERQADAQERIPVPDTTEQDEARLDAISQEKARQEQEAKRRQEQIDLTERKRQEQAEQQRRLAAQQEEDRQKRVATEAQQKAEAERQKKIEDIRRQRAQAAREAQLAEQKLRQLADARARQAAGAAAPAPAATGGPAGNNGTDEDLRGRYAAAIQEAVLRQWTRPESVPVGTRCKVVIRQLPGGEVVSAEVQSGCAMDAAGQDSVERAVLKAQPLPYRGYESVFARTLTLNFEARDR
ncbi:Cell division and transport-associated protein TolA [Pseudoxanthomonas sp. CF385]|uniref:cell envelope integrity protein TolA n=1 Tax=Pseudoxanthomonas sp. CF385 TaxID=1881042 RepID=UPI00088D126F|nr:cell envelope integrity protein TolA [Pseudoxanthomonas sp. CF385]SDQ41270.1 Cell division and transport-associated protein TolA [Pseudoxanthomonas sp. CF385]